MLEGTEPGWSAAWDLVSQNDRPEKACMYMLEILPGSVAKGKMDAGERSKEKWSAQTNVAEKKVMGGYLGICSLQNMQY